MRAFECQDSGSQGVVAWPSRDMFPRACVSFVGCRHVCTLDSASFPMQPAIRRSHLRVRGALFSTRWRFQCVEAQLQQHHCNAGASGRMKSTERARDGAKPASRPDLRPTRRCSRCLCGTGWRLAGTGNNFRALALGCPVNVVLCQPYVPLPLARGREPPQTMSRQPHFDGLLHTQ